MSKAMFLAAALLFIPPGYAQAAQSDRGGEASSISREASSNPMEVGATQQGDRGEVGDVLDRLSESQLKDRLVSAIDRVRRACADDFEELCGGVTPGEGRIASCLRDNAEDLSLRCRLTLYRTARNIRRAVENVATECESGLAAQCGNAEKIGECVVQKSAFISPACHTIVTTLRDVGQKAWKLRDMPVFSSDDKDIGRVVQVIQGPDGKLQSVQIQVGRFLGIGDKVVTITADQLQNLGDRVRLKLGADQLRSLPEAKKQGT
jgi:hypothetical protein